MKPLPSPKPPDPSLVRRIQYEAAAPLTREAFLAYVSAPWADGEREENRAHIEWFLRRYPTPSARLAYNRRRIRELADRPAYLRPPPPLRLPETPVVDLDAPPEERDR